MRWELLFADLEAHAEGTDRAAFDLDVADRGRSERAALTFADRLRAHRGAELRFALVSGDRLRGTVLDVGKDWVLLDYAGPVVVPTAVITGVEGLSRAAVVADGEPARRMTLGIVLRGLCRDRAVVRLGLLDGSIVTGTIDRVGADHLDLAEHPVDEPRRHRVIRGVMVIRLAALAQIRTSG